MVIRTCPTDLVRAPADRVWDLLMTPRELERWADVRVREGPARPLAAGDRLMAGAGPAHRVTVGFRFIAADRPRQIEVDVDLPFGITNHEVIRIAPAGSGECRVTFS